MKDELALLSENGKADVNTQSRSHVLISSISGKTGEFHSVFSTYSALLNSNYFVFISPFMHFAHSTLANDLPYSYTTRFQKNFFGSCHGY
jgi:hypothetical protein